MADIKFNTGENETIAREKLVLLLNIGTIAEPDWAAIGKHVESSDMEFDWQRESKKDIRGNTYTTMKKPIITQPFDPWELSAGDPAQVYIWNKGIKNQDAQAMANCDTLVVHEYAGSSWAERYDASSVEITRLGGDGGGNLTISATVTYGGNRTVGTVTTANGTVTFVPEATSGS